jgi:hypothetical protein
MPILQNRTDRSNRSFSKQHTSRRALLAVIGGVGAIAVTGGTVKILSAPAAARGDVTLYKNPECECCEGYADYLRHNGFEVKVIPTNDLTLMGKKYGIPDSLQPCHLSLMAGYVVGGHIPIEVINRLLSEKPQIAGITLPGMPTGTPGMPGEKPDRLTVYEILKGSPPKVYATV